ncbi:MAG: leucyl aminopeptidase [Clostridia bacterium]|nr:leucyl aminopeptidase [Clostridia bacterium]
MIKQMTQMQPADVYGIFYHEKAGLQTTMNLPETVEQFLKLKDYKGKKGEIIEIPVLSDKIETYMIIGLGEDEHPQVQDLQKYIAKVVKKAKGNKATSVAILAEEMDAHEILLISEALVVTQYDFDAYKSDKKENTIQEVHLMTTHKEAMKEGAILGEATVLARQLVNEPANVLNPIALAEAAEQAGKSSGFEVKIFDEHDIQKMNMIAYWEVAKSSDNKPRFIVMTYKGNPESEEILGLVGKGLTYDSGGYSIKTKDGMITMKSDMGGSAAVIGAMKAIAEKKLNVNVTAVIAACENMISGGAYRPGDIIGSRGGKTIFIQSTDAEGRLTLIDAVDYIIKDEKVTKVIDIATLTGACLVALGTTTTGIVSNNDEFYQSLDKVSKLTGERVWRMPVFPEYYEILKHKEADLVNATRMAGMITAGMFIGEFVGDTPWIHMDIAGTSWVSSASDYYSNGGTGAGVKNLYFMAKEMM